MPVRAWKPRVLKRGDNTSHVSEILSPFTILANRALDVQIIGRTVPANQVVALPKFTRLLQDHGMDCPPLLTQVMHELAWKIDEPEPAPEVEPSEDVDLQGLTRFFASFRIEDRS